MASRFYSEQEPQLYDNQFGDFYYDPGTGGFVSAPAMSGIGAPEVAYYEPEPTYEPATVAQSAAMPPMAAAPDPAYIPYRPLSATPRDVVTSPVPDWAKDRTSENIFILEPNRLTDGSAAVSPIFIGGSEAQDSSYFTGNDPTGGDYLGYQYGLAPSYSLTEQFGEKLTEGRGLDVAIGTPGTLQRVVNIDTGKVLYEGTDIEGLVKALDQVSAGGNKAQWKLEAYSPGYTDPSTGKQIVKPGFKTGFENIKEASALGQFADLALPIAMNILIPGSGFVHAALTAAAGTALSGTLQGKSIADIAKSAIISGVAAGVGGEIFGQLGGTSGSAGIGNNPLGLSDVFQAARGAGGSLVSGIGGSVGAGIAGIADDALISVTGSSLGSGAGAAGSAVGGGLGAAASGGGSQQPSTQPQPQAPPVVAAPGEMAPITVTGSVGSTGAAFPSSTLISGITAPALSEVAKIIAAEQAPAGPEEEILVEAPRAPEFTLTPPLTSFTPDLRGITQALPVIEAPPVVEQAPADEKEILVEAPRAPEFTFVPPIAPPTVQPITRQPEPDLQPPANEEPLINVPADRIPPSVIDEPAIPFAPLLPLTPQPVPQIDKPGPSLKDVVNTAGAVVTGIGVAGDLIGGDDDGGTLDPGTGYTVGGIGGRRSRTRRVPANFDPFTYGQKEGEFEFFGDGMAEGGEVDDDMVRHLVAYRKGGGHAGPGPVKGIGSGQEDKIPAWLSDGEYVWSAQDVADLGDGSTDEGVRRLDRMRQMVRKGAGRKNVKKIAKPQRGIQQMLKAVGGAV
jgi:hypothetical protein